MSDGRIKNLPDRDRLSSLLREYRTRAGLTQADAALLMDVSLSAMGQWEAEYRRPSPYILDLMSKAYALSEYETYLLFYEAGYAPYNTPPVVLALFRAWSELEEEYRAPATELLKGALELLEVWIAHSRSLGIGGRKRTVPDIEEMARYWEQFREDRYHRRRVERALGPRKGDAGP